MTYPSGETPTGALNYEGLEDFSASTGADFILSLVNSITAVATGYTNLQDALEKIASQIGFPEFAQLLLAAFEGILGSFFDFLPWFINLSDLLGFDLNMDPDDFNPVTIAIGLVERFLELIGLDNLLSLIGLGGEGGIFEGLFGLFGGSGNLGEAGNFFENLLGMFGLDSGSGLLGSSGSFDPTDILSDFVTGLLNPLGLFDETGVPVIGDIVDAIANALSGGADPGGIVSDIFDGLTGLLGSFGGATDTDEAGNFLTNLLSVLGSPTGLTGDTGTFDPIAAGVEIVSDVIPDLVSGFAGFFNGWFGGSSATGTPAEVVATAESIRATVTGGYTLQTFTSSDPTWSVPTELANAAECYMFAINGGQKGTNGSGAGGTNPGFGGVGGGFRSERIDPSTLTSTLAVTVGAAGASSGAVGGITKIMSGATTLVQAIAGIGAIGTLEGYIETVSAPGDGGDGGDNNDPGTDGTGNAFAAGGGGAAAPGTGNGFAGGAGGAGQYTQTPLAGGGGGGGGSGGNGIGTSGGVGGAGGFPGGASGGAGAASGTAASSGAAANGLAAILWR